MASASAWNGDPCNVVDPAANPLTYVAHSTYPAPARTAGDTSAQRVPHDRADQKRDDVLSAHAVLKDVLIESFSSGLCDAAAASTNHGRLMLMSAAHIFTCTES